VIWLLAFVVLLVMLDSSTLHRDQRRLRANQVKLEGQLAAALATLEAQRGGLLDQLEELEEGLR